MLVFLMVVAGCIDTTTPAPPAELPELKVSLNGEPVQIRDAAAYSRIGGDIAIVFSDGDLPCSEFKYVAVKPGNGSTVLSLTIAELLQPDGSTITALNNIVHLPRVGLPLGSPLPWSWTSRELDRSVSASIDLTHTISMTDETLQMQGRFTARGCGLVPNPHAELPAARPQTDATISLSGKVIDIHSAILRPTTFPITGHELTLSTTAAGCTTGIREELLTMELIFGENRRVEHATLKGEMLGRMKNDTALASKNTIEVQTDDLHAATEEIPLNLSGVMDINDYALQANGTVMALP